MVRVIFLLLVVTPSFASDLESDVMKPLGRALSFVSRYKADPAKSTEVAAQCAQMVGYVELGLTLEPTTQAYSSLKTEIGAENARRKFLGLMETLRASALQLQSRAQKVSTGSACADACGVMLDQMRSIEELGHTIFAD